MIPLVVPAAKKPGFTRSLITRMGGRRRRSWPCAECLEAPPANQSQTLRESAGVSLKPVSASKSRKRSSAYEHMPRRDGLKIVRELYKSEGLLGADPGLVSITGSWGATLDDEYNAAFGSTMRSVASTI